MSESGTIDVLEGLGGGVADWFQANLPGPTESLTKLALEEAAAVGEAGKHRALERCMAIEEGRAEAHCQDRRLPNGHLARNQAECMAMWADGVEDRTISEGSMSQTSSQTQKEIGGGFSGGLNVNLGGNQLGLNGNYAGKSTDTDGVQSGGSETVTFTKKGFEGYADKCARGAGLR